MSKQVAGQGSVGGGVEGVIVGVGSSGCSLHNQHSHAERPICMPHFDINTGIVKMYVFCADPWVFAGLVFSP